MKKSLKFVWSEQAEPHRERTKEMIRKYPEIRALIGRNRNTVFVILFCMILQIAVVFLIKDYPWWIAIIAAYVLGAFIDHTLFVSIHECAHNLVFKSKNLNTILGIVANSIMVFPSSVSFQKYHLKHHTFQGVEELDADMPFRWEAKLIGNSALGKFLWLLFYPVFQMFRPLRLKNEITIFDGWTLANWLSNILITTAIFYYLGSVAGLYLVSSLFFSIGFHPVGARWIQEHFLTHGDTQETKSYYGILNIPNLNIGYHNEHHDFPSIPWQKLPKLKEIAPEYYENLAHHTSYTILLFQFLFDKNLSVASRVARANRGKVALEDMRNYDVDIAKKDENAGA